jgi:hypothetical protein
MAVIRLDFDGSSKELPRKKGVAETVRKDCGGHPKMVDEIFRKEKNRSHFLDAGREEMRCYLTMFEVRKGFRDWVVTLCNPGLLEMARKGHGKWSDRVAGNGS